MQPGDRFAQFYSNNKKFPVIFVPIQTIPGFVQDTETYELSIVEVRLLDWDEWSRAPAGMFLRRFGQAGGNLVPPDERNRS